MVASKWCKGSDLADAVVNYSEPGWPERVGEATSDNGANLIIESVGGDIATG